MFIANGSLIIILYCIFNAQVVKSVKKKDVETRLQCKKVDDVRILHEASDDKKIEAWCEDFSVEGALQEIILILSKPDFNIDPKENEVTHIKLIEACIDDHCIINLGAYVDQQSLYYSCPIESDILHSLSDKNHLLINYNSQNIPALYPHISRFQGGSVEEVLQLQEQQQQQTLKPSKSATCYIINHTNLDHNRELEHKAGAIEDISYAKYFSNPHLNKVIKDDESNEEEIKQCSSWTLQGRLIYFILICTLFLFLYWRYAGQYQSVENFLS